MRGSLGWMAAGIAGLLIGAAVAHSSAAQNGSPAQQTVPFHVFAADAKTLLFNGEYKIERAGSRIAESQQYVLPAGKLAKLDESVYDAERSRPISFFTANYLSGEIYRIQVNGETLSWQAEDASGAVKSRATDSLPSGTYVWPNLANVMAQRWDAIGGSKQLALDLYVVSRKLRVGLDIKPGGREDVAGIEGVKVKIEPSAWMYRQMASPNYMTLSVAEPHRLLRYQGNGAITGADGKAIDTVIVFDWPQQK